MSIIIVDGCGYDCDYCGEEAHIMNSSGTLLCKLHSRVEEDNE